MARLLAFILYFTSVLVADSIGVIVDSQVEVSYFKQDVSSSARTIEDEMFQTLNNSGSQPKRGPSGYRKYEWTNESVEINLAETMDEGEFLRSYYPERINLNISLTYPAPGAKSENISYVKVELYMDPDPGLGLAWIESGGIGEDHITLRFLVYDTMRIRASAMIYGVESIGNGNGKGKGHGKGNGKEHGKGNGKGHGKGNGKGNGKGHGNENESGHDSGENHGSSGEDSNGDRDEDGN